jgi:hypothetical protein
MKYKYRVEFAPAIPRGRKSHSFNDRNELVLHFAKRTNTLKKIYSADAHGYLKNGDTFDGIRREIQLTRRIVDLEKKLKAALGISSDLTA